MSKKHLELLLNLCVLIVTLFESGCGGIGQVQSSTPSQNHGSSFSQNLSSGTPVLENGYTETQVAAIAASSNPLSFSYRTFDTVGDGKIHSIIAGDYDGSGTLDWSDLSALLQILCPSTPKTDAYGPFCGTLYIPPGTWNSISDAQASSGTIGNYGSGNRCASSGPTGWNNDSIFINHDTNPINRLRIIGSGIDKTILTMRLSRPNYCKWHGAIGGGGIWLYHKNVYGPGPNIEVAGFTYNGLPGRTTNSKLSCLSDTSVTLDTAYSACGFGRVTQDAISIYATTANGKYVEPLITSSPNASVHDVLITQADYIGVTIAAYDGVQVNNITVGKTGTPNAGVGNVGAVLYNTKNAVVNNVNISHCQSAIPEGAFHIESSADNYNGPGSNTEPAPSRNSTVNNITITDCYKGIDIVALGSGGIDNVTFNNVYIDNIGLRNVSPWTWSPIIANAINISDDACFWVLPAATTPCYITNLTFNGGTIGTESHGISGMAIDGLSNVATGLTTTHHNWTFQNLNIVNAGVNQSAAMVSLEGGAGSGYTSGLQFINNTLNGNGNGLQSLLALQAANNAVVSGNSFFGTLSGTWASQAFSVYSSAVKFVNNNFALSGGPNSSALTLHTGESGDTISGNTIIATSGLTAINVDAGSGGHTIASNTLIGPTTYGLAVNAGLGNIIEGNIVDGSEIYIGAEIAKVYSNTIYNSPTYGINDQAGSDIRNNIVSNASTSNPGLASLNVAPGKVAFGTTNWFTGQIWGTYSDLNGQNPANKGDPLFINAVSANYHLQQNSPCIGAGQWPGTVSSLCDNEGICSGNVGSLNIGAFCWVSEP
ncbi:MAG TPA: hypothetical protein VEM40_11305 [Nitrospirota bacterium]|nr:hypothetical protein [Nitrospirota bacterium]